MTIFRLLLVVILLSLSGYTAIVVSTNGLNLLPVFFSDIAKLAWPGQFNFDFMCFLVLSASWVMWRNKFSALGIALGVLSFFGGALFLSVYLLFLSFRESPSIRGVLVGDKV